MPSREDHQNVKPQVAECKGPCLLKHRNSGCRRCRANNRQVLDWVTTQARFATLCHGICLTSQHHSQPCIHIPDFILVLSTFPTAQSSAKTVLACVVPIWITIFCQWSPVLINYIPIGSMYAIYGNIYHQHTPNVSIYTIHGSVMGSVLMKCTTRGSGYIRQCVSHCCVARILRSKLGQGACSTQSLGRQCLPHLNGPHAGPSSCKTPGMLLRWDSGVFCASQNGALPNYGVFTNPCILGVVPRLSDIGFFGGKLV